MRNYETVICPNCGKEFKRATNRHRFCTPHCENVYHTANSNGLLKEKTGEENRLNPPSKARELKCRMCGKMFSTTSRHKVYCSDICRKDATRLARVRYQEQQDLIRLRKANEASNKLLTRKKSQTTLTRPQLVEGKLWDNKVSECKEVMEYLKTVEPIDWEEINRLDEEERKAKLYEVEYDPKTHKRPYIRRNSYIKRCL